MPDWLLQLLGMAFAAGGVYAGIRADLRHALGCAMEAKKAANRAHERIDNFLTGGRHGKA